MDETLMILKAKEGDENCLIELFKKYQPLVLGLKKRFFIKGFEHDDWVQEALISFYESVRDFDLERKVTLGLFFKINFQRKLMNHLRKQKAIKRTADRRSVSLEEITENGYPNPKIVVSFEKDVEICETLESYLENLSSLEQEALFDVLGISYNRGKSNKNARTRAKIKMEQALGVR